MSNKNYNFFSKLFHKLILEKYRLIIVFIVLVIVMVVIIFVNINSSFKIIEGNRPCKFSQQEQEQMEGKMDAKAKKYEKDIPNQDKSKSILSNVSDLKSKVNK